MRFTIIPTIQPFQVRAKKSFFIYLFVGLIINLIVQSSVKRHDQQLASLASDVAETAESVEDQRHHKPVNTQHKTKSIGYGIVSLSMSMSEWFAPGGYSEKEDNFIGQLYVSQAENLLSTLISQIN